MRISDWSSDVCSSDLSVDALSLADYDALFERRSIHTGFRSEEPEAPPYRQILGPAFDTLPPRLKELHGRKAARRWQGHAEVRRGTDRKSVVAGKSVSVRVDPGGRRIIKNKKKHTTERKRRKRENSET